MEKILPQIDHIVVVMLENRSFDTMLGWLYANGAQPPSQYLPNSATPKPFDGLNRDLWNPRNPGFFTGDPPEKLPVMESATSTVDPNPDPLEDFPNVTEQLYGKGQPASETPKFPNLGFAVNYLGPTKGSNPVEIMEAYSLAQLPRALRARRQLRCIGRVVLLGSNRHLAQSLVFTCGDIERQCGERRPAQSPPLGCANHLRGT
jgi:phospholipase C